MSENLLPFATAVVIHQDGQHILLHKREDFRIGSLPGGGLDDGETAEGAAIRETFEEAGYQIAVDRFVGSYRHVQFGDLRQVYCGHVIGGQCAGKRSRNRRSWLLSSNYVTLPYDLAQPIPSSKIHWRTILSP